LAPHINLYEENAMRRTVGRNKLLAFFLSLIFGLGIMVLWRGAIPATAAGSNTVLLAWNDLGMHCYNRDFQDLAVLPPYNTLWAQVLRVGDPPQLVTSGVTIRYSFPDNTYSVGKTNFWTYAQALFDLPAPLANNVGLTGKGLSGTFDLAGDHFIAEGIPLTEFSDSAPTTPSPYQLALVIASDSTTGAELARTTVVAPVSTEMRCDNCHSDRGRGNEGIATGRVETNILTAHDEENGTHLMASRPVLCASCHASNALGTPGNGRVPNLSNAMHDKHSDEVPSTQAGCYNCHPGPQTLCLRDVMSQENGMTCTSCHGNMNAVASNPNPWLNEPRCDTCHDSGEFQQNHALYRFSTQHGGLYCSACHDSPHAVAPSREANDALKFIALQGHNGPIDQCTVCHATTPTEAGPHGQTATPGAAFNLSSGLALVGRPGSQLVFRHTLQNTGSIPDTYTLNLTGTRGWGVLALSANGAPITSPVTLGPGQSALVTVTVTIPSGSYPTGTFETSTLTASSAVSPGLDRVVVDTTWVARSLVSLPMVRHP
jgi:hypothetical protein